MAGRYHPGAVLSGSGIVFEGGVYVGGLSIQGGGAGMTVTLHEGSDATGPVMMSFTVGADESDEDTKDAPYWSGRGVFADVNDGSGTFRVLFA
jgi:hypothetical protein